MTITICGSIAFYKEMLAHKETLEAAGHTVLIPPAKVPDKDGNLITVEEYYTIRKAAGDSEQWVWDLKKKAMKAHFDKIAGSDAILVLNIEKNGVPGYIGANTFLEIGLAVHLNLPIYLLNPVPESPAREELLGSQPIVLNGDLAKLA